jgi:UDP-N-acetylmuramate dehydrogenase
MIWPKALIKQIKSNQPLARLTTFKIGGNAEFYFQPASRKQLRRVLSIAAKNKLAVFFLGAGSNILISDRGISGLVIRFSKADFKKISLKGASMQCACAASLNKIAQTAKQYGLSGAEFLCGIPGSLGGALLMNAGAWGRSMSDIVEEIEVMEYNGKIKVLKKNQVKFGYRVSSLKRCVILGAKLKLSPAKKDFIANLMREYLSRRLASQNTRFANAGCIFKNPPNTSAGKLIDLCGLKGAAVGKAEVCARHANFILNRGNAECADVLRLMRMIQEKVKTKFKINLQPEIKIWR